MGVEAVHHAEILGQGGGQLGQVGGTASAEDEHVDLLPIVQNIGGGVHGDPRAGFDGGGIAAGKHPHQLAVGVLHHGGLNALSQVSVSINGDFHRITFLENEGLCPCPPLKTLFKKGFKNSQKLSKSIGRME